MCGFHEEILGDSMLRIDHLPEAAKKTRCQQCEPIRKRKNINLDHHPQEGGQLNMN